MNNRSMAPKKAKRFSFSISEPEAYALERHHTGAPAHAGDAEALQRFRRTLTLRMTKHEAEEFAADIGFGSEAV